MCAAGVELSNHAGAQINVVQHLEQNIRGVIAVLRNNVEMSQYRRDDAHLRKYMSKF